MYFQDAFFDVMSLLFIVSDFRSSVNGLFVKYIYWQSPHLHWLRWPLVRLRPMVALWWYIMFLSGSSGCLPHARKLLMDVDVTATSSTFPNSRCIIVSVFLRSHAWPLHGPRKGFFTLWRLQCKNSLLEKISLPKKYTYMGFVFEHFSWRAPKCGIRVLWEPGLLIWS